MAKKEAQSADPNKDLELAGIDYENLMGEHWDNYQKVTAGLLLNNKYDFHSYKASSVGKFKLDEDNGEKVAYVAGIRLNSTKPIQKTRLKWSDALELNAHVSDSKTREAQTSVYYLLVKPQV
jgi:hypothetical protein